MGRVVHVLWRALQVAGLLLICLPLVAIEVVYFWAVGAAGFALFGWHYPARVALILVAVGVVVWTAGAFVVDAWERRPRDLTIEDLIALGHGAVVNHDDYGRLWTFESVVGGEEVRVVEVVNMTPNPDGSHSRHFLRAPPSVRSAREVVAWTFGFGSAVEYALAAES